MEGRNEICSQKDGAEGLWAGQLAVGFRTQAYPGYSWRSCHWEGFEQATPTWQAC